HAEQLGHASIRVAKDVCEHPMPGSRAKAAEAMRMVLFEDDVHSSADATTGLVTQMAAFDAVNGYSESVPRYLRGILRLSPSTLRVFPECPGTSPRVQICWPDNMECPPASTEVLSGLNLWLDSWLDQGTFQGVGINQFRGADGEVFALRLGDD